MANLYEIGNFAIATLSAGITDVATTINVVSAASFPTIAANQQAGCVVWNATDYSSPADDPSVEIVYTTAISGTAFTVTRAQEGTTGVAHNTANKTYKIAATVTRDLLGSFIAQDTSNDYLLVQDSSFNIGCSATATHRLQVQQGSGANDDLTTAFTINGSGTGKVHHTMQAATGGGDVFIEMGIVSNDFYSFGIDNSDSDFFVFSRSTALGSNFVWKVGQADHLIMAAPNAAPTDADMPLNSIVWYLNEAGSTLTARIRESGGYVDITTPIPVA